MGSENFVITLLKCNHTQNEEIEQDTPSRTSLLLCTSITIKAFHIACFLCNSEKEAST